MIFIWIYIILILAFATIQIFITIKIDKLRKSGDYPQLGKATPIDVQQLLRNRKRLLAIRCYREVYKVGLREAKQAIEVMEKASK